MDDTTRRRVAAQLTAIRRAYPQLSIRSVELVDHYGQFNDVLFVDRALVFRFPRSPRAVEQLERELALLDAVGPRLSLAVPVPRYRSLGTRAVGQAFAGYPLIPGRVLGRDELLAMGDSATLDRLAAQLATFLRELHAISLDAAPAAVAWGSHADWEALYRRMASALFPFMRPDAQAWTRRHFESMLDDPDQWTWQPRLRHGDFGPGNILYDDSSGRLSGVIDWGFAGIGDPAQDVAALICERGFGEPFLRRCYAIYPELEAMVPRARRIAATFALQQALYALEDGDQDDFEDGIAEYR